MRSRFDEQLATLKNELISMGALCEEAIALAAKAVLTGDAGMADKVSPLDGEIEQKERTIESLCLKLLLQQQPVARDLRQISAALKMITDLERIGDQAADVAEIVGYLGGRTCGEGEPIGDMAREAIRMVTDSVEAFVRQDLELSRAVVTRDDVVDELFDRAKASLVEMLRTNAQDAGFAVDLLMIAKHLERIADHAVSLAEWVEFAVTGIHKGEQEL